MKRLFLLFIAAATVGLLGMKACTSPETRYTWTQGKTDRMWLERADKYFCYLTKVTGNFQGDGEMVRLRLAFDPQSTVYWVIDGASEQQGVSATAECSSWSNFDFPTHEVTVHDWAGPTETCHYQYTKVPKLCCVDGTPFKGAPNALGSVPNIGGNPTKTGCNGPIECGFTFVSTEVCAYPPKRVSLAAQPAFCYLAGMKGNFDGSGDSIVISSDSTSPPGAWHMTVSSSASDDSDLVQGAAACVGNLGVKWPGGHLSKVYEWTQGQPVATPMLPSNIGVCFLTSVSGRFRGGIERVEIVRDLDAPDDPQLLTGGSQQAGVRAEARCLRYEQLALELADRP